MQVVPTRAFDSPTRHLASPFIQTLAALETTYEIPISERYKDIGKIT